MSPTRLRRHDMGMLAAAAVVAALGVADSINPVTILVALYLGSGPDPVRRLGGFIGGVFAAYLAGGLALMLGPAELLRGVLSGVEIPGATVKLLTGTAASPAIAVSNGRYTGISSIIPSTRSAI